MRKTILTILGIVLLASSAFGSDVLFKMVMTNRTAVTSTADAQTRDLRASNDAYFLNGGNVTKYSTTNGTPVIASGGLLRITNSNDYATVTLPAGITLQAGDVISYVGNRTNDFPIFIDQTAHARNGKTMKPSEPYTVQAGDFLVGANSFYLGYGKSVSSPHNEIKSITITRPNANVKFYDFEPLVDSVYAKGDGDYTTHDIATADGEVQLNSDGDNKIEAHTSFGGANMLKLAGSGLKRALLINLTEPCSKIEVWATRESDSDSRKLFVSDDRTTLYPTGGEIISSGTGIQHGEKTYAAGGRPYDKTLYISPDKGGWHILAVRITTVTRSEAGLVIKNGDDVISAVKQPISNNHTSYTVQTSSPVTPTRTVSDIQTTNVQFEDPYTTLKVKGRQEGVSVITISQAANEDYHAAEATLTVTVEPEAKSLATFDGDLTFSNGVTSITSGNYMLYTNAEGASFASSNDIYVVTAIENETPVKARAIRFLASGDYEINVPSNIRVEQVTIQAQAYSTSSYKVTIDGEEHTFGAKSDASVSDIHTYNLTNKAFGKKVVINTRGRIYMNLSIYGVESTLYPVTINHGWASFCAPEDVELPEGVTAYYAKEERDMNDDVTLYVVAIDGNKVPANEGVILSAETDGAYHLRATTGAPALADNRFGYTTKRTANPNVANTYTLWYDSDEDAVVFAKYTGAYIPANKAYYTYNAPGGRASAPKRIRLVMTNENAATGIESQELKANSQKLIENGQLIIIKNGVRYNAQGQIVK